MARPPTPTWFFTMVVVRRGSRFLLMQEAKYGRPWTIPGGRVEHGEQLVESAVREVLEETGIPVAIDGIWRIEHEPTPTTSRCRFIFSGHTIDDTSPKVVPDQESLGAAWLTLDEIRALSIRGKDLIGLLEKIESGFSPIALDVLGPESSM